MVVCKSFASLTSYLSALRSVLHSISLPFALARGPSTFLKQLCGAANVTVTDDVTFGSRANSVIPYFLHFPSADFPLVFAIHTFSTSSPRNRPYLIDEFWSAVSL